MLSLTDLVLKDSEWSSASILSMDNLKIAYTENIYREGKSCHQVSYNMLQKWTFTMRSNLAIKQDMSVQEIVPEQTLKVKKRDKHISSYLQPENIPMGCGFTINSSQSYPTLP